MGKYSAGREMAGVVRKPPSLADFFFLPLSPLKGPKPKGRGNPAGQDHHHYNPQEV